MPDSELLSPAQPCERVPGLTVRKLASQRQRPGGPSFYTPTPQTVVYDRAEHLSSLRAQQRTHTDRFGARS
ncbi:hypothetical protein [Pseudoclavibacter sp. 8L]|uniref:hypothetical protein n=1 Tax=Pseudoclavibacter sp. 8L TaxID=2653162 RepID=UPI0012F1BD7A|nr:hypothetical protein [Pseudoclavibacter sp. 8L]VXB29738.1 conserved hypothetical protein [Pseudoclavibacter sp. 8L]